MTTISGDSGGPVFVYKNSRVEARGTHTGIAGHEVVFQDFYTAAHDDFPNILLLTQ